jgi:hypothetical protein
MSPITPQSSDTGLNGRSLRDVLRERQQASNARSCLPCRERKVKCNHQLPCSTCSRRGHPDLCSYPVSRTRRSAVTLSSTRSSRSRQANQATSIPTVLPQTRDDTTLVSPSSASPFLSRDDNAQRHAYENGILPLLGLESERNNATQPAGIDSEFLLGSLPNSQEMVNLFEIHRLRCHPFHIITYDIDTIQAKLCRLINSRNCSGTDASPEGQDLRWICLLHAIFAAGAQSSDLPHDLRTTLSQRHSESLSRV